MTENLCSTNIAYLVNEDDTDINDDMVDKILNELENTDKEVDNNEVDFNEMPNQNMNYMNNMEYNNEIDFTQENNIELRDNLQESMNLHETDNTVKKINSILEDNTDNHLLSLNSLITHAKLPLIVFLLVVLFNNSFVTKTLSELFSKLIKNDFITDNISLFLRALISAIIIFSVEFFQIIN